ncbi:hypothetical protein RB195_012677 [Necator americanus]|uniref:Uncharacterized protein n=1 Tax=Necator americanus TaxID=51031 RepID=A0ABR1DTJ8_NECAM
MATNIETEIERENDASLAMDREIQTLWQELAKYQMACTDDYTGEILDEESRQQYEENEARCASLSVSNDYIKGLLESSSSIYDTANCGVRTLSNTITQAAEEVQDYYRRVIEAKRRKEQALNTATECVTQHKEKLEVLRKRCLPSKDYSSGIEKLSTLLSSLKISENTSFTAMKDRLRSIGQLIQEKNSHADLLRRSLRELESKCEEADQLVNDRRNILKCQQDKIAEQKALLKSLEAQNIEGRKNVSQKRQALELLLRKSSKTEVSLRANEAEDYGRKLDEIRSHTAALKTRSSSESQAWKEEFCSKEDHLLSKIAQLELAQSAEEKELHTLKCQLEQLKENFKDHVEMIDRDKLAWDRTIEEQCEAQTQLDSEIAKFEEEITAAKANLVNSEEDGNVAEAILAVEHDLLAYMESYNEERRGIQEQRAKIMSKVNTAQNMVTALKTSIRRNEDEHQKLLSEIRNVQAQIEAFTNLRTPAKQVLTSEGGSRKTSGRRTSRRIEEVDSDNESPLSGVPFVEGLQSFSPATLSFKEMTKEKSMAQKKRNGSGNAAKANRAVRNSAPSTTPTVTNRIIPPSDVEECVENRIQDEDNESVFESLLDLSGSEKSLPCDSLVAKRFPSDIFLNRSPSLGQNESCCSLDVSAICSGMDTDKEDADQSVWSVVPVKNQTNNSHLDTTAETDLDQSVW